MKKWPGNMRLTHAVLLEGMASSFFFGDDPVQKIDKPPRNRVGGSRSRKRASSKERTMPRGYPGSGKAAVAVTKKKPRKVAVKVTTKPARRGARKV